MKTEKIVDMFFSYFLSEVCMKKVAIEFTYTIDIVLVPDEIAINLDKYQLAFDAWIYDKNNEHGHWILYDGEKVAVSFGTETFVDFLNNQCSLIGGERSVILKKKYFCSSCWNSKTSILNFIIIPSIVF